MVIWTLKYCISRVSTAQIMLFISEWARFNIGKVLYQDTPVYVDEDYPAGPGIIEPLPKRSNWCGSELSTLENDVYVWRYALIVVHASNEW